MIKCVGCLEIFEVAVQMFGWIAWCFECIWVVYKLTYLGIKYEAKILFMTTMKNINTQKKTIVLYWAYTENRDKNEL